MKRQRMNQQEGQAANLSRSPQAGNVTNFIRTHSHESHSSDQHCTTTNNQSNQVHKQYFKSCFIYSKHIYFLLSLLKMEQAVSSLNVSHELDESVIHKFLVHFKFLRK